MHLLLTRRSSLRWDGLPCGVKAGNESRLRVASTLAPVLHTGAERALIEPSLAPILAAFF